jgi:glycosyltransferase involved in cell wall biosynthesis
MIFAGWRQDVLEILSGCDLFIFPSLLERLSNSILEAMTCNLPCLVSEIIEKNEVLRSKEGLEHFQSLTMKDQKRFVFNWEAKIIEKAEEAMTLSP